MTLAVDGRPFQASPFEARVLPARKRARAALARLRWAVAAMVLLNAIVWGGMIATARGVRGALSTCTGWWTRPRPWPRPGSPPCPR